MKSMTTLTTLAAGLLLAAASLAQAPAGAPAGTTGLCKDGSYYTGATKKGACRGHKGVQTWYGEAAAAAPAAAATKAATATAPATATPTVAAAAPAAAAAAAPKGAAPSAFTPPATAAAGGGPGQVWVNMKSKVYHCSGDKWYGKTKEGQYMTEAEATAKGFHPDHGKACK
jgi:hypothetical protein